MSSVRTRHLDYFKKTKENNAKHFFLKREYSNRKQHNSFQRKFVIFNLRMESVFSERLLSLAKKTYKYLLQKTVLATLLCYLLVNAHISV